MSLEWESIGDDFYTKSGNFRAGITVEKRTVSWLVMEIISGVAKETYDGRIYFNSESIELKAKAIDAAKKEIERIING